ncbi:MAG TPA: TetR family transcriptional regulator [Lapillicoccus sp.]|nr:TetR family transcriptional regulator [Lapillicoccus sp.]
MNSERRTYTSTLRAEQSARTRAAVITAARGLFLEEGGYARTSLSALAAAAGVSVQTIYNTFGSKAGLLKAVFDTTLAGDDDPIPMGERPLFLAMERERDPSALLHHYARIGAVLMKRMGPLLARVREGAAAGDPDLAALVETSARERLVGATQVVASVRGLSPLRRGLSPERARDIVWTHTSYELWDLLVLQRGWSAKAYADYLGASMSRALLEEDR